MNSVFISDAEQGWYRGDSNGDGLVMLLINCQVSFRAAGV